MKRPIVLAILLLVMAAGTAAAVSPGDSSGVVIQVPVVRDSIPCSSCDLCHDPDYIEFTYQGMSEGEEPSLWRGMRRFRRIAADLVRSPQDSFRQRSCRS